MVNNATLLMVDYTALLVADVDRLAPLLSDLSPMAA
jgi:hypothetical protein